MSAINYNTNSISGMASWFFANTQYQGDSTGMLVINDAKGKPKIVSKDYKWLATTNKLLSYIADWAKIIDASTGGVASGVTDIADSVLKLTKKMDNGIKSIEFTTTLGKTLATVFHSTINAFSMLYCCVCNTGKVLVGKERIFDVLPNITPNDILNAFVNTPYKIIEWTSNFFNQFGGILETLSEIGIKTVFHVVAMPAKIASLAATAFAMGYKGAESYAKGQKLESISNWSISAGAACVTATLLAKVGAVAALTAFAPLAVPGFVLFVDLAGTTGLILSFMSLSLLTRITAEYLKRPMLV